MRGCNGWRVVMRNLLLWSVPGAAVLGTSCVQDIRNSIVAAGLDFVESTAGLALEAFIPVGDFLPVE